jgi:uncharacterized damage-inducible protein DinB
VSELSKAVTTALAAEYRMRGVELHKWVDPLSEEQFWKNPFTYGNSAGHLVLHLTGNLSYYIGAQIAETRYIRDRPREFSESARPPKEEVLKKFDAAIEIVLRTIRSQSPEDWSKPYTATGADARDRFDMVLQCATHLHHHVGQMMYLGFELKRKS